MAVPVVHRTVSVERTYPAPPARVFAAFADPETKRRWFAEGEGWSVSGSEKRRATGGKPSRQNP